MIFPLQALLMLFPLQVLLFPLLVVSKSVATINIVPSALIRQGISTMQKHVQHIMYHNCYHPNPARPIKYIRFITKSINPLDIVNIPSDHPPETITKVSTTERNRIHNLTSHINNIIMGITSTGSNTADPRTNTNCHRVPNLQGFQL